MFLTALLHEDLAILAASFLATRLDLSIVAVLITLYVGVLTNNCAVYGLGAAARRLPRLRRWLIGAHVDAARQRLQRRLLPALALGRFVPGLLSPTLLACGWLGIPLTRFLAAAAVAAALYLPFMLSVAIVLGETVLRGLGEKAWTVLPALTIVAILIALLRHRRLNGS